MYTNSVNKKGVASPTLLAVSCNSSHLIRDLFLVSRLYVLWLSYFQVRSSLIERWPPLVHQRSFLMVRQCPGWNNISHIGVDIFHPYPCPKHLEKIAKQFTKINGSVTVKEERYLFAVKLVFSLRCQFRAPHTVVDKHAKLDAPDLQFHMKESNFPLLWRVAKHALVQTSILEHCLLGSHPLIAL